MKQKKVSFILNPKAGRGSALEELKKILPELEADFSDMTLKVTEGPQHATELSRDEIRRGSTLIVAVGGDGTVSEVVNGMFDDNQMLLSPTVALAILPTGTGDDLKRSFAWDAGIKPNIFRLREGTIEAIDIGLVTSSDGFGGIQKRFFVNAASCGFSAKVTQRVRVSPKWLGSTMTYYWEVVKSVWRFVPKDLRVELDSKVFSFPQCSLLAFANGQYFGAGMKVAPEASLTDGMFDLVSVSNLSLWNFMRHGYRVYRGEHLSLPQVSLLRGQQAVVECQDTALILIECDGEEAGQLPAKFEILPGALPLLV